MSVCPPVHLCALSQLNRLAYQFKVFVCVSQISGCMYADNRVDAVDRLLIVWLLDYANTQTMLNGQTLPSTSSPSFAVDNRFQHLESIHLICIIVKLISLYESIFAFSHSNQTCTLRKNSSPHCKSSSQSGFCRYSIEWAD